jgi:hypothetical protein
VTTGPLGGVEVPTAATVGMDANQATISNANPERIGLADFTRDDGALRVRSFCVALHLHFRNASSDHHVPLMLRGRRSIQLVLRLRGVLWWHQSRQQLWNHNLRSRKFGV